MRLDRIQVLVDVRVGKSPEPFLEIQERGSLAFSFGQEVNHCLRELRYFSAMSAPHLGRDPMEHEMAVQLIDKLTTLPSKVVRKFMRAREGCGRVLDDVFKVLFCPFFLPPLPLRSIGFSFA